MFPTDNAVADRVAADVVVVVVVVVEPPAVAVAAVAAWNLVKTVSAGWHSRTDTAPDTQPAMKSTYASDKLVSFVEEAELVVTAVEEESAIVLCSDRLWCFGVD